jgi:hypothetical protein
VKSRTLALVYNMKESSDTGVAVKQNVTSGTCSTEHKGKFRNCY